eukprot:10032308-Alexandrium_andersonii.AAC.1
MEWLAFEFALAAKQFLETVWTAQSTRCWRVIGDYVGRDARPLRLDLVLAPNKMAFTGDTMESTAPGANSRTDVHLVVFANSGSKGI